jgi:ABC-type sulfate transport system substrate-binding protein
MVPELHRWVILAALEATTASSPRAHARATGLLDSEYDVSRQ